MGHGIAYVCATAGLDTVLYDVDLGAVDDGLKLIRTQLGKKSGEGFYKWSDDSWTAEKG